MTRSECEKGLARRRKEWKGLLDRTVCVKAQEQRRMPCPWGTTGIKNVLNSKHKENGTGHMAREIGGVRARSHEPH